MEDKKSDKGGIGKEVDMNRSTKRGTLREE